jgi:4-alpha-glucanotransferase
VSGILAHPTSFPGPHGIGDLGDGAEHFVDWLARAGQHRWQIMPLVPTGYGDSPYASPSAFAGNPLMISLDRLVQDGLLDRADVDAHQGFDPHRVEFEHVRAFKEPLLRQAFERVWSGASPQRKPPMEEFARAEGSWLHDFATFMAAKDEFQQRAWPEWDSAIAHREPEALASFQRARRPDIQYHSFVQYLFRRQWLGIRNRAASHGIAIIGDIPIFVAYDSADVWANRDAFQIDERGRATVVAGVPPDYFSADGQLWGNPHYDWQTLASNGYRWWIDRFRAALALVDVVRIDHFRGFAAAWSVPAGATTAAGGRWDRGPGKALFAAVTDALGPTPIIVEDLGLITSDVVALRQELGLPGMAVLQFAFDGDATNAYLPHNFERNLVVYTGTHDNQTTIGWFRHLGQETRRQVQTYLGRDGRDIAWDFIRLAYQSVADTAVVPLQDVLRLGDEARMNTPGTAGGNWSWRYSQDQLTDDLAAGLARLTTAYARGLAPKPAKTYDPYDYSAPKAKHVLHGP